MTSEPTENSIPGRHKRKSGRPRNADAAKQAAENSHNFLESCARVNKADWGSRAIIYLYRSEPIIDRSRSGDYHYIDKYSEPITEDRILTDHGSGKYRVMLNFQRPGADSSTTLDSAVITLLNIKFPPKIAPGDWVDDPKNNKWAWAKESFPKPPSANGTGQVLETLKVFNDIRKGVQDEQQPQPPPQPVPFINPVSQVRETIQALKELAPQPAAATENKTLDSIVQLMISQIQAQATQNATLLQTVLTQRNPPPGNSLTETITVLSDKLLPLVEKLKPTAEDAISNFTRRSKMAGWMEMLQPALPAALEFFRPFGVALANRLMNPAANGAFPSPGAPPAEAAAGALPAAGSAAPGASGTFPPMLNMIAVPMLEFVRMDADPHELGRDFANWVNDGYGANPRFAQALSLAKVAGVNSVIVAFKGSPWWLDKGPERNLLSLSEMEPKFTAFVDAFLKWQPEAEEDEDESDVIDISAGAVN